MNIRDFTMKGSDLPNLNATALNIKDFKPTTLGQSRAGLRVATDSRLSNFKDNGNSWDKPSTVGNLGSAILTGTEKAERATSGFFQNVGTGIAGSFMKTAKGIGDILGLKPTSFGKRLLQSADETGKGTLGKPVGEAIGGVSQFMAPGGAEEKLFATAAKHIDDIPKLMGLGADAAKYLTGALKIAARSAITGGSTAGVTAAQTGGNKSAVASSGVLGGISGGFGEVLSTFGKGLAETFQKSDFKLSPSASAKASGRIDSAAQFMTNNKILGSDESKYSQLSSVNNNLETALQSSLPKTVNVSKKTIIDNINARVESLRTEDPAIYSAARSDADQAIKTLQEEKGSSIQGSISLQDTLKSKRSYGQAAFRTTQFAVKDPRVVSEGSYAVEQGFQDALSGTLKSVKGTIKIPASLSKMFNGATEVSIDDFNKVYSDAISSKNLTGMARFKKDTGLLGRFFGLWVGESVGQAIAPGLGGKLTGATVGELASTRLPGMVRNLGERAIAYPQTTPKIAKGIMGTLNETDQNQ